MDSEYLEEGLTNEDRPSLCVMPTLEEVWETVSSINPDSVAGPDGFGPVFFHTCWEIISEDVFGAVTEFFRKVEMPKGFTATTISLISKTASPTCWTWACLAKGAITVANGFVPRRLLSDNVLLAQELIHSLESRRPEANVVFKLDMAKAYDGSFGSFSISEHAGFFHSTCGLRQGDPLSPALFVLAADYLSRDLDRLFAVQPTMHYQAPGRIRVSHLAYADDLMIFTTTCRRNMELLHDFLRAYERVSGQLINGMKSSFIVGRQGWAMTNLSHGGSLALIRSVLQATPLYLLQVIHLPNCGGGFEASHPYGRNTCMVATVEICIRLLCLIIEIIPRFGIASVAFEMWRSHSFSALGTIIGPAQLLHSTYTMEPVSYYWHEGDWNVSWILRTVPVHFAQTICQILVATCQGNKIVWTGSSAGDFVTKSAWEAIRQASPRRQLLADIWHRSL
ncbi:UNVERIFIED_CONTAM: hypothetical protein Sradi_6457400 [Sesamum radiatum]|uniref:Reverse transcriptase domain-containing protein n=1 Tax=Sesamum radiatum TaxID=300843 RepID=A0AAW2K5A6_SESRA